MTKNTWFLSALLCLTVQAFPPGQLFADGDVEFIVAHPMPLYPGSVAAKDSDEQRRLSKDDLGAVKRYFESRLKPGDRIETFSKGGETGFKVVYARKIGRKELTAFEVSAAARTEKRPLHTAFGELSAQVQSGRHKDAELQKMLKEYGDIDSAYYRGNEYKEIAERAGKEAHPDQDKLKAAGRHNKVSADDKAEAKELKRKMKELKAQGDIAGMMALAQNSKKFQAPPANQMEAAKLAAEDRSRDTWDIWVRCLKDTKAAAYRTELRYGENVLK
ncbi:MAG: hypothetical protein WC969_06245 [Elusimicrobiota bacterium]|jgi:hypothetical protein